MDSWDAQLFRACAGLERWGSRKRQKMRLADGMGNGTTVTSWLMKETRDGDDREAEETK